MNPSRLKLAPVLLFLVSACDHVNLEGRGPTGMMTEQLFRTSDAPNVLPVCLPSSGTTKAGLNAVPQPCREPTSTSSKPQDPTSMTLTAR